MVRVATLAAAVAIGAILGVGGWSLLGPPTPREIVSPASLPSLASGSLVENGVAVIVACGEKRGLTAVDSAPEPRTGTWEIERRGACKVYYHHPPDAYQREARQQRAQE